MKAIVVAMFIGSMMVSASCINLADYKLSSRFSSSEVSSFNTDKMTIYRNFILSENKINNTYTSDVQNLYQFGYSDSQLKSELSKLEASKNVKITNNCNHYKRQLSDLVRSFR